jgi:hypothetical protein
MTKAAATILDQDSQFPPLNSGNFELIAFFIFPIYQSPISPDARRSQTPE